MSARLLQALVQRIGIAIPPPHLELHRKTLDLTAGQGPGDQKIDASAADGKLPVAGADVDQERRQLGPSRVELLGRRPRLLERPGMA